MVYYVKNNRRRHTPLSKFGTGKLPGFPGSLRPKMQPHGMEVSSCENQKHVYAAEVEYETKYTSNEN